MFYRVNTKYCCSLSLVECEYGGPGEGGASGDPLFLANIPSGGGFGGTGGASFSYIDGSVSYVYGAEYAYTQTLIGGSAGGEWSEQGTSTAGEGSSEGLYTHNRLRGGGAMQITASNSIFIDSSLSANGENGQIEDYVNCKGGGSGGMIQLIADTIILGKSGYLNASGGSSSYEHQNKSFYCGGGGAGGVIRLFYLDLQVDDLHLQTDVSGGIGNDTGEDGIIHTNFTGSYKNVGVYSSVGMTFGTIIAGDQEDETTTEKRLTAITNYHQPHASHQPPTNYQSPPPPPPPSSRDPPLHTDNISGSVTPPPGNNGTRPDDSKMNEHEKIKESTMEVKNKIADKPPSELRSKHEKTEFVEDVVDDFDSIVNETDTSSSDDLSTLIYEIEDTVSLLANSIKDASNETITITASCVGFDVIISVDNGLVYEGSVHQANQVRVDIPKTAVADNFTDDIAISHVIYSEFGHNLNALLETGEENETYTVNGRMISITVQLDNEEPLIFDEPIEIVFENLDQDATESGTHCVYWKYNETYSAEGVWSSDGCNVSKVNRTHTTCHCYHLTSFSILLQATDVQIGDVNEAALSIITYVGLSLSLFALIITLIIMIVYFKRLNYECTSIHINLVIALIIADSLFLFGIEQTDDKNVCTGIAIFMHYFFLVVFMWMAVEAMHMYSKVRNLNQRSKRHFNVYYPIGWGVPAIIVIITMAVRLEGYGTDTACWLAIDKGTVWAFIAPVIAIISLNTMFIAIVLKTFTNVKSIKSKPKREQIRRTLRAAVVLLPIFGLTWVFGLITFNKDTLFFQYLFAIFNSLQGFFIFLFHCCFNGEIKNIFCSRCKKVDNTFLGHSKSSGSRTTQVVPMTTSQH
ncbi:adhesion G protein-coupled receptor E3-like [Antedon mediterranea]|uniref:adhesion G protein-coupled receptor E3-like n=1 Tax=Antedon mediterranea TaxID=105859 RepID=UPI003AF4D60E